MATRSDLRKEFRTLLNEVGSNWINDSTDASLMTVDDLLWQAYKHVSKELECFPLYNLGIETIADQEFYEFGAFGYHAEELDKIVVSEAADDAVEHLAKLSDDKAAQRARRRLEKAVVPVWRLWRA